jgi:hypothetical protein
VVRRWKFLTFIVVASTVLAGCHLAESHQSTIQRWGGVLNDLRYQWDGEPGIDMLTGAAVPVRAYIESRMLAQSMGNLDYAYPGFTRAVPPDPPDAGWGLRPNVNHTLDTALVGNARYHILSLSRSADAVTATVCNYDYSVAHQVEDGKENNKFESVARRLGWRPKGIFVERVTLAPPSDESSPLAPQAGPSPAPSDDVFGNWRITGYLFSTSQPGFKSQWPSFDADLAKCVDKASDPPERRAFLTDGEHPRSDFPTSPATPGWPAS